MTRQSIVHPNRGRVLRSSKSVRTAANFALENLELRRMLSATLESTIISPNAAENDTLGSNIVTHGNLALVQGSTANVNGFPAGKVELYDVSSATPTLLRTFTNPAYGTTSDFGRGMTFLGNDKVAIAAPSGATGVVWIYDLTTNAAPLVINSPAQDQLFGISMAAISNGVGGEDLLVGTPMSADGNGAIYRYTSSGVAEGSYTDPRVDGTQSDQFGLDIVVDGSTIYSRSYSFGGASMVGSVIAVDGSLIPLTSPGTVVTHEFFEDPQTADPTNQFGNWISVSPVTHDVFISGSRQDGTESVDQFHADASFVRRYVSPRFGTPDARGGENFLVSTVTDQNQLVVGAPNGFQYNPAFPGDLGQAAPNGSVYVFDAYTGASVQIIDNPTSAFWDTMLGNPDQFGYSVAALPGGRFMVGDPGDDAGAPDAGAAYVYQPEAAPVNQAPTAVLTQPTAVNENQNTTLDASGSTDPDGQGDISSYSWDLNNDGIFGDAFGAVISFTQDLPGSYPVSVKVTDSAGHESVASSTAVFNDVAPTANAGGAQNAQTGQQVNFAGSGTTAPGDSIVSYEWDFNYGGNPNAFNVGASGTNASHTYAAAGTYTVALRVTDDDGQIAISTTMVVVTTPVPTNHAPVAGAINGPTSGVTSQNLTFNASYTDEDSALVDPRTVSWNFGDGNSVTGAEGPLTVQHAYNAVGTYTVTFTVTDSHGASSNSQLVVSVTSTAQVGNDVYVGGTSGNDTITIDRSSGGMIVIGSQSYTASGRIIILAGAGNDTINVGSSVFNGLLVDGGDGNDLINGGHGDDILIGGAGNDTLVGDVGRDLLIGGTGSDVIIGNSGDDILIAGKTSWDGNVTALEAIMAEWTSGRTYTQRVNNLIDGSGSATRANGSYFVTPDVTAFDDGAIDSLSGDGGQDWIICNVDAPFKDVILSLQKAETVSDVDALSL